MATRYSKRNKKNTDGFYDDEGPSLQGRPRLSHMSEFDRDILDRSVHVPETEFLFTLPQVSTMLAVSRETLHNRMIHFGGRSIGKPQPRQMVAVNIAPNLTDTPMWRISEKELRRYLKVIGIPTY